MSRDKTIVLDHTKPHSVSDPHAGRRRTAMVLGAGPVGLTTATELLQEGVVTHVVLVTEPVPDYPVRWPVTAAFPIAAGYLQPFQAAKGIDPSWWLATRDAEMRRLGKRTTTPDSIEVAVDSVHNHDEDFRPEWAQGLPAIKLAAGELPEGCSAGFRWTSVVLDPVQRREELGRRLLATKRVTHVFATITEVNDVRRLVHQFLPDVILDALGITSGPVFDDERLSGRIGHLLTLPNTFGDRRVVMDDDAIQYVISGPRTIFIGGTYIDVEVADVLAGVGRGHLLDDDIRDHLLGALERLRPDLAERCKPYDTTLNHRWGVRPYRTGGPRLESTAVDGLPPVVHATGLGGSGWSLIVGFARAARDLIRQVLDGEIRDYRSLAE